MTESQLAVLRLMADGKPRASWQVNADALCIPAMSHFQICRPAVELKNVGLLSRVNGMYGITEFGRKALEWHTEGKTQ